MLGWSKSPVDTPPVESFPSGAPEDLPDFPFPEWDRYEPMGYLGEGFFGLVFKVRDRELDRPVALKFLHAQAPERLSSLREEAKAQAHVDHPNFCRIYEVGSREGRPYIAMQFIDGRPLDERARDLGLEELVEVLAELAEAVDHGHRLGLAHRDLKANNVLLEARPGGGHRPCILDFGQARLGLDAGQAHPGDIWALGEMAYTLLGGFPSAAGPSSLQRAEVPPEPRPPLHQLNPQVPPDLGEIVHRALCLGEGPRYASAADFAAALRAWLGSRTPPGPSRVRKRLALILSAGLALGLLGVGLSRPPRTAAAPPPWSEIQDLRAALQRDTERLAALESRLAEARSAEERARWTQEIEAVRASLRGHREALERLEARLGAQVPPPHEKPVPRSRERSLSPPTKAEGVDRPALLVEKAIPAYPPNTTPLPSPLDVPVDVRLDARGRPLEGRVGPDLPAPFRDRAIEAALASRYAPATSDGEPIESWLRVTYRFARAPQAPENSPVGDGPVGVLRLRPLAVSPEQLDRLRTRPEGPTLTALVHLDAQGHPTDIRPQGPVPADLEMPLREAVQRSSFRPEIRDGRPREGWITVSFPLR